MNTTSFEKAIDKIQSSLVWFVISVITICIAVLFLFDVLAGTGSMLFLTSGKMWQSVVISLATTGLLFALMFIGYMLFENKILFVKQVGGFILFVAGLIYIEDIIFDALLADILRYGTITLGQVDAIQWMFRFLLGGISTVGDALAISMVLGLPVLKSIIGKAVQTIPSQKPQVRNGGSNNSHIFKSLPKLRENPTPVKDPTYHPIYNNTLDNTYPAIIPNVPDFLKNRVKGQK